MYGSVPEPYIYPLLDLHTRLAFWLNYQVDSANAATTEEQLLLKVEDLSLNH